MGFQSEHFPGGDAENGYRKIMDKLLCGIDGGGTKTTVLVSDQYGNVIGSFQTGSVNHYGTGIEKALDAYRSVHDELLSLAGRLPDAIYIGSSALDGQASDEEAHKLTGGFFRSAHLCVHSDVFIALLGFTQGEQGAILISGTGSMACGLDNLGRYFTSGGWGQTLGDEGSGYHLALMGIQAALRGFDGVSEPTVLTEKVMDFFRLNTMTEIIDLFYNPPPEKSKIAAFAPEVERSAVQGDLVAQQILDEEIEWLRKIAVSITLKCNVNRIGMYGSMLVKSPVVGKRLGERLLQGGIEAGYPRFRPETGALFGAFRLLGIPLTPEVLSRLEP